MNVLLMIPAYNEEGNILKVCRSIDEYKCNKNSLDEFNIDYVVINDGSTDGTFDICKENNLNMVNLVTNLGIGGAVQTGYRYAFQNNYDIAVQFDGDGQHDINFVKKICEPLISGKVDLCIGSRYLDDTSSKFRSTFMRRVGKNIISTFIKVFTGERITDPTSGFRAANVNIIRLFMYDYPTDYPEPESIVNVIKEGYSVKEVPVSMNERIAGKSSINVFKSVHYMIKVVMAIIICSLKTRKKRDERED